MMSGGVGTLVVVRFEEEKRLSENSYARTANLCQL